MSKKIMKRSLALGALMPFVITGSAWAAGADETKITGEPITTRITDYTTLAEQDGVVRNNKFSGITTNDYAGGVFKTNGDATFDNCIFSNNMLQGTTTVQGGVIDVGGNGNVVIKNSTFENNTAKSGPKNGSTTYRSYGAAISSSGTLTIDNSKFGVHYSLGSKKPYGGVIRISGGVTSISNTDFINSVGIKFALGYESGIDVIYNGAELKLENNKFEDSNGNCINNIAGGTVKISGTKNEFTDYTGRGIYNYGELIFEEGSKTIFTPGHNGRDITNRNGGSITIKEGATVTLGGVGIDLDEGTSGEVNLFGTVNGNIGGNNIVKFGSSGVLNGSMVEGFNAKNTVSTGFCEVEFKGGTWNLTGDSTVAKVVVNGDSTIDGTIGLGSNGDKPVLTADTEINNNSEYFIKHKSGNLTINNLKIDSIIKETDTGSSRGSVISGYGGSGESLLITNSEISNNISRRSSTGSSNHYAIIDSYADTTIQNTEFKNNTTNYMGGVLYLHGKVSSIEDSKFISNTAGQGAAIQSNGAAITLKNNTFNNNIATKVNDGDCGGAICAEGASVLTFEGKNTFNSNKATGTKGNGGAIAQYHGSKTINTIVFAKESYTEFKNNIANNNGGAIWNGEGGIIEVNGELNFTGNIANGKGNDIYNIGEFNINQGATVKLDGGIDGAGTTNINGGNLELGGNNRIGILKVSDGGKIAFGEKGHLDVDGIDESSDIVTITMVGKDADDLNTKEQLTTVAERMGVAATYKETDKVKVVMAAGEIVGKTTGDVVFETQGIGADTYYHGVVKNVVEAPNPANEAISDTGISMKLHWRAHVNDMNKRMGELRDANGEHGVWTRMVRGESEYKNTKAQYNQYQLGYDEKLSVDKRWTVGAAVTFSEGDASYGYGSTEDKSTAFAIYGSKLNNDGTFVDLIARYAHLESDVDDQVGKGSYSANGMSVSAEFGKRIQQGNGLWIEPQAELTYGTIDSAEYKLGTKTVEVGDMDSLIGRIGFRIGKDIEKGNVYARASYLYDFEGETENAFRNDTARRSFNEDLGGGWWEVGVGANINLSKATYVYADVEKTFGGEVDTNWQWNLGVRYSF